MKKLFCLFLSIVMLASIVVPFKVMAEIPAPVMELTFDKENEDYNLRGNAKIVADADKNSGVLSLDGSDGTYAELTRGFFDGRNQMTITMDVKSYMNNGNFFTFAYGADTDKYSFLRLRGCETVFSTSTGSYQNARDTFSLTAKTNMWQNFAIVIDDVRVAIYVNGVKASENTDTGVLTSNLGTNLKAYLGKSFFGGDLYFKGCFDNFKVYNQAFNDEQVLEALEDSVQLISSAVIGTVADKSSVGTDNHTASNTIVNGDRKVITPYVRQSADLKALPVKLNLVSDECQVLIDGNKFVNGAKYDLTKDRVLTVTYKDRSDTYTLCKARIAYNAVLPGQYGDPDIDYINGKYWMFPTTDGYTWWGGYQFHAFSSTDLVNWTDEGVIIDLKNDKPGKNTKGVQIASCEWSDGQAWAPTIEYKNGKCYFYFVGHDKRDEGKNKMAIGVAVATNPAGPYTVSKTPILTEDIAGKGITEYANDIGDTIDPAIFTDDDGTSYLLFGNTTAAMVKLNKDMISLDMKSFAKIDGLHDFLESVYITKRNGLYHFTWSCYGTNGQDYCVKYGVAKSIAPENGKVNVDYKYTLLEKDTELGILCSAHQGMLYMKDLDRCFIAYHRFCTPLEEYTDGYGFHRECCIDEVKFDSNGLMKPLKPTMGGTGKVTVKPCSDLTVSIAATSYTYDGKAKKPAVTVKDSKGKAVGTANYTVSYSNNTGVGTATVTVKFKNAYAGTVKKTFKIIPKVVLSKTSFVYNGKVQRPTVSVYDQNGKLSTFNYKLTYSSGLKNVGTYKVTIKMVGKYTDTITKTFTIVPQATTISSLTPASKALTVKWKKKTAQTTGYQIQYSTDANFKKGNKTVTISKNGTTSKKITKLAGKKRYYVRIRTYKKVGSTTYYSAWSAKKNVVTKK